LATARAFDVAASPSETFAPNVTIQRKQKKNVPFTAFPLIENKKDGNRTSFQRMEYLTILPEDLQRGKIVGLTHCPKTAGKYFGDRAGHSVSDPFMGAATDNRSPVVRL
jgi:hypothetical protein